MKFSILRDEIYEALQKVVSVIPQRSTIAMTQNVKVTAAEDQLELMTTDLEITMISHVKPSGIEEEGALALPGRQIHDLLRELPNIPLTFESDTNHRLVIRSEFGQYKIGGENPAEFPQKPQIDEIQEIQLPNDVLKRLIDKTIFACSTDELRPSLTGVYFEIGGNRIQAVATDGHRLALLNYTDESLPAEDMSAIISTRALNFVLRSIEFEGVTAMMLGNKHALFHMDSTQLYARLIEEMYVDYTRVIPTEINYEMAINADDFHSSVKRVSLFSNPITAQVVLKITKDHVEIQAEDMDYGGEAKEEIPHQAFNGEEFKIGFNSRYLQTVLRHVDSDQVVLRLVRPDFAVIVKPSGMPDNEDQLMLLMPIRLENA
jgi:DNA polymerase-3 subunit beta